MADATSKHNLLNWERPNIETPEKIRHPQSDHKTEAQIFPTSSMGFPFLKPGFFVDYVSLNKFFIGFGQVNNAFDDSDNGREEY